jgi:hypothetical protein
LLYSATAFLITPGAFLIGQKAGSLSIGGASPALMVGWQAPLGQPAQAGLDFAVIA